MNDQNINPQDMMIISQQDLLHVAQKIIKAIVTSLDIDNARCIEDEDSVDSSCQDSDKLLTTDEVLDILKISQPTLWRFGRPDMIGKKYYLPRQKMNGKNMYRASDVNRIYTLRFK